MNLKELKSMIAEEYSNYLEQEEVAVDVQPDVDVDADMDMDMGGEEMDSEDTLRAIYNMLSDYFEKEDEMGDEEMPMDDVEGEEAPEADLEEFYPSKAATTTKSGALGASGYKNFSKSSGHTGFGDSKSLNEGVERMKKLANIIK
jgi:hypothetical protein|tara:strand:- start:1289 stop:1723 length:435 start_codon:yes stop_codon:yes gene_type:complete